VLAATAELRERHPDARWTPPEQLHLTMVFLGSTPAREASRIDGQLAFVTRRWRSFRVTMGAGDGFTERRRGGGVAWLRVAEGYDEAARLALALDSAIGSDAFEKVPPRPHLTLARGVTDALLADLRAAEPAADLGWSVDNLVLFRSHSAPGGSRYEELSRHPLVAG
jgi:RNA 2',3'-cyclic 3'-phosphodiesterase